MKWCKLFKQKGELTKESEGEKILEQNTKKEERGKKEIRIFWSNQMSTTCSPLISVHLKLYSFDSKIPRILLKKTSEVEETTGILQPKGCQTTTIKLFEFYYYIHLSC